MKLKEDEDEDERMKLSPHAVYHIAASHTLSRRNTPGKTNANSAKLSGGNVKSH